MAWNSMTDAKEMMWLSSGDAFTIKPTEFPHKLR